jgi:hypothetical protein
MRILTIAVLVTLSGSIALAQQLSPQPGSASASQMPVTSGQTPAAQTSAAANPSTNPSSTAQASQAPSTTPAANAALAASSTQASTTTGATAPDAKKDVAAKDVTATASTDKPGSIASPGEDLDPHIKKGTEEDVDAVGQRNIGGRGMRNWYSTNWEISTGKQYSMEIEKSSHLVTDPVVVEYINRIGQNLVKNSDAKVPFTIKVLDTDEINAMALPGGYFYVNSGLILACDSEDELAGVMAHEIAHVAVHHAAREMTRLNFMQLSSIPLMIFSQGTWTGYGIYEVAQLTVPLTFLQFSREYEAEADYLGIQYMYRAGYDPQGMVSIFEKLDALEKHKPGAISRAFSDHPATPERIAAVEHEIATILPARPDYLVTTSEFDQVKARLERIQNKRGIQDKKGGKRPTLRRVGSSNNDPNAPQSSTSDQPTLGRRD